ncbi:hypothetical protein R1flu_020630 [Riccia fluitans]|uniref:Uncharacterized protein n=1 Tax=Riccia fluitans TaxID=41844 RepID=A0ABD1ZM20_9MARC
MVNSIAFEQCDTCQTIGTLQIQGEGISRGHQQCPIEDWMEAEDGEFIAPLAGILGDVVGESSSQGGKKKK